MTYTTFRKLPIGRRFRFQNPTPHRDGICIKIKPSGYRADDGIAYICVNATAPVIPVPLTPTEVTHLAPKGSPQTICGFDLRVDYLTLQWTQDPKQATCSDCRPTAAPCGPDPETREG